MELTAVTFASYRTSVAGWRKCDYDAHDFVRALTGESINEYAWVRVRGHFRRFDDGNRQEVVQWFGMMVADHLDVHGPEPPYTLVPVPSIHTDLAFTGVDKTMQLAVAIQRQLGCHVCVQDALRFRRPLLRSRDGGSRTARAIYEQLHVIDASTTLGCVVLIDDVLVTGEHLCACAAKLLGTGKAGSVLRAICGASAENAPIDHPFGVRTYQLSWATGGRCIKRL
jgi:predicted amidophosphoribosyltransferase